MPRLLAAHGKVARESVAGVNGLDLGLAGRKTQLDQIDEVSEVMRSEHDVDMREAFAQCGTLKLPDTATHRDDALGLMGVGNVLDRGDLPHEPQFGLLAHAARDENGDVGLLDRSNGQGARRLEHAGNAFGIVFVHLAAKGALPVCHAVKRPSRILHVTSHHHCLRTPACGEKCAVLFLVQTAAP